MSMSAQNAIAMAEKYNRKVRMLFNGISVAVTKRLSVKHVVGTWKHMLDARQLRYRKSSEGRTAKAKRLADISDKQSQLDSLMLSLPNSKEEAAAWIAKWVPLSDDSGVDRHGAIVAEALRSIGFVSSQHVGEPEFEDGTASRMMRIEYIAGQVISSIETIGCVHPLIGKWAADEAGSVATSR